MRGTSARGIGLVTAAGLAIPMAGIAAPAVPSSAGQIGLGGSGYTVGIAAALPGAVGAGTDRADPVEMDELAARHRHAMDLHQQGEYARSLPIFEEVHTALLEAFGERDLNTLAAARHLALTLRELGHLDRALAIQERVHTIRLEDLGERHADTLTAAGHLAFTLHVLGQLDRALAISERIYAIRLEDLGERHPGTLIAAGDLAVTLHALGQFDRALAIHERVHAVYLDEFGERHPVTLAVAGHLASAHYALGHLNRALAMQERLYAIRLEDLGERHPETLIAANNLAWILRALGHLDRALEIQERVHAIRFEEFGELHTSTLTAAGDLAVTLHAFGQFDRALTIQERVYEIRLEDFGDRHPKTLIAAGNLAMTLRDLGYLNRALAIHERVHAVYLDEFGERHYGTATAGHNLARTLYKLGQYDRALALQQRVHAIYLDEFGERHPGTLNAAGDLASTLGALGDFDRALAIEERGYTIRSEDLGERHPETLTAAGNLAGTMRSLGRLREALEIQERVYAIIVEELGERHPETLTAAGSLAGTMRSLGRLREALEILERVYAVSLEEFGERHGSTLGAANNLALTLGSLGRLREALSIQERVYAIIVEELGERHGSTLTAASNLALTLSVLGDFTRASLLLSERVSGPGFSRLAESLPVLGREDRTRRIEEHARPASLLVALSLLTGDAEAGLSGVLSSKNILMASARSEGSTLRSLGDPAVDGLLEELAAQYTRLAALTAHVSSLDPDRPVMNAETLRQQSAEIDAKIRRLERELRDRSPEYRRRAALQTLGVDELAALLGPGEALVEFVVYRPLVEAGPDEGERRYVQGDPHYAAFVLRPGPSGPQVHAFDLGPAEKIDAAMAAWRGELETFIGEFGDSKGSVEATVILRSEFAMAEHGWTLRERLWDPLSEVLAGSERVFVSPDGPVSALPLEALPTAAGADGYRYLIETGPSIVYLGGGRDLAESRLVVEGAERGQPGPALLVGDPDFDAGQAGPKGREPPGLELARQRWATLTLGGDGVSWKPLPSTGRLVETVNGSLAQLGIDTVEMTGREATASVVRWAGSRGGQGGRTGGSPSVLLVATHGQYFPPDAEGRGRAAVLDDPMLWSRLVFAGINTAAAPSSVLTAREAALLDLRQTELVLLVACHSGEGDALSSGQGVAGLRSSFLLSGARRVVGTLFEVPAEETVEIIESSLTGHGPGSAGLDMRLREAKLGVMEDYRQGVRSAHPFFWAGPTLAGDPGL